jgi:hypothetical protein
VAGIIAEQFEGASVSGFSIQCTTCRRSLRVTNPEAIGQILSCPKCGSMVLVEAPAGWTQIAATEGSALKSADLTSSRAAVAVPESVAAVAEAGASAVVVQAVAAVQMTPAAPQVSVAKAVASKPRPRPAAKPANSKPVGDQIGSELVRSSSSGALKAAQQGPPVAAEKAQAWKHPPIGSAPITAEVAAEIPAAALAEPAVPTAATHPWPKWFWPGVAVVLAASCLILTVRMFMRSGNDAQTAAIATDAQRATDAQPAEAETPSINASAGAAKQPGPATIEPVADERASDSSKESKSADIGAIAEEKTTEIDPVKALAAADGPTESATMSAPVPPPADSVPPPLPQADVAPLESIAVAVPPPANSNLAEAEQPHPGPQRTLQRVPPRVVNVATRMATPIRGLEVRGQGLADFVALVSDATTIPITLDADALLDFGQSPSALVSVKLMDTTVSDVLDGALEPLHLGYQLRDGQLIVGYPPQEKSRQVRYAVSDLAADDAALGELAALVRRMIAPESWQQAGGKGSIVAGNGTLVVNQTEPALAQILVFCEKLRVARGLPVKSRLDPTRFVLNTREDKAHEMLNRPVTANFATPQPLSGVVKWLHESTGATILVNHAALAEQAMCDDSECTGAVVKKPLATLFDELTGSAELAWRAIDEKTIEVTTRQDAGRKMDVEFYAAGSIAGDSSAAEKLTTELKSKIEPQLWGDASGKAAIHFDLPSRALIVRAPQRSQALVEAFLLSHSKAR